MRTVRFFLFVFFCFSYSLSIAQRLTKSTYQLQFFATNHQQIVTDIQKQYYIFDTVPYHLTTLRFYISSIQLLDKNKVVWKEKNSYHLIDVFEKSKVDVNIPLALIYDQLSFIIGVDSAIQASEVKGGDLDPMHGMYWSWQSGYIDFKLEGNSPVCDTRNHEFIFHIGGYKYPFSTQREIKLNANSSASINIGIDVAHFLEKVFLQKNYHLMSPGIKADEFADIIVQLIHTVPSNE